MSPKSNSEGTMTLEDFLKSRDLQRRTTDYDKDSAEFSPQAEETEARRMVAEAEPTMLWGKEDHVGVLFSFSSFRWLLTQQGGCQLRRSTMTKETAMTDAHARTFTRPRKG